MNKTEWRNNNMPAYSVLKIALPNTVHLDLNTLIVGEISINIFDPSREFLLALKAAVEKALE